MAQVITEPPLFALWYIFIQKLYRYLKNIELGVCVLETPRGLRFSGDCVFERPRGLSFSGVCVFEHPGVDFFSCFSGVWVFRSLRSEFSKHLLFPRVFAENIPFVHTSQVLTDLAWESQLNHDGPARAKFANPARTGVDRTGKDWEPVHRKG